MGEFAPKSQSGLSGDPFLRFKLLITLAALPAVMAAASTPVQAKGCIGGALAGAVAGHYAHHHAIGGAAVGCAAGHYYYKHKARTASIRH